MKKILNYLSSVLLLVSLYQPAFTQENQVANKQQDEVYIEIPYEFVKGKIIIKLKVEGVEGRYIYDTGAPTIITHARFIECGDKKVDESKIRDANGNFGTLKQIYLETVQIGDLNLRNMRSLVLDKGNPIECFDVDGLIGNNIFVDYVVRMDEKRKVLIISNNIKRFDIKPEYGLPLRPNMKNQTYININFNNNVSEPIMFDTGSADFYELNEPTYKQAKDMGVMETISSGHGATSIGLTGRESTAIKYKVKIPELTIGKGKFKDVITTTMNGPASRIGSKILKHGIVTIDYPNQMFYFEPHDSTAVDMYSKNWNVSITVAKDHLVAGLVWESIQDQLQGGEKIVEINGQRFDKIDFCDALTKPIGLKMDGEKATIVIVDSTGKEKKIEIQKE